MKSKYNLYLVVFVFTAIFVVSQLYLLIPVNHLLVNIYQRTSTDIALLTSYFGFAYASGFLVWGVLSDRFGRKVILITGLVCLATTTWLLSIYSDDYQTVLTLRVVQGFAASAFPPVALAYISESFPVAMRLKGIAWMSTAFLLSALVGQWLGGQLISESITHVMEVFTVLYIISIFLNASLPKQKGQSNQEVLDHSESNTKKEKVKFIHVLTSTVSNIQLLRLYIVALSLLASFVSLYAYLVSTQSSILPMGLTVSQLRIYAIPCMFAPIFVGHGIKRFGAEKLIIIALFLAVVSLFSHTLVTNTGLFIVLHMLFVIAIATIVPSVISLIVARSNHINRGFAVSLYTFTLFVGASFGALMPTFFGDSTIMISAVLLGIAMVFNIPLNYKKVVKANA